MTPQKPRRLNVKVVNGTYRVKLVIKDQIFVDELKRQIGANNRGWDPDTMSWVVSPRALPELQSVIRRTGYQMPDFPPIRPSAPQVEQKVFRVEYIGQCKKRDDESITALGQVYGYWSVEIPEDVLKAFFDKGGKGLATDTETHYQILGLEESATPAEIKTAYRRYARQWHPDVCVEPEAPAMFRQINESYELLANPIMRKRYDFGLHFEREAAKRQARIDATQTATPRRRGRGGRRRRQFNENPYYRCPLRCGLVTVEGVQTLSKFKVSKILAWDDVTDQSGNVMSSSWESATKSVKIRWI